LGRTIEPGQTEKVEITMQVPRGTNQSSRKIMVQTNDRNNAQATLECVAVISQAVKLSSPNLNFGQVPRSSGPVTKTITITRGDGGPLSPEIVPNPSNKNLTAELKELRPGEEYELVVTLSPPWPNEMMHRAITLKTGVEQSPQEIIPVVVQIMPRLAANPPRFSIPATVENDLDLSAQLSWSDGQPAGVTGVTTTDGRLKAEITERDNRQVVVLHVPAGYTSQPGTPSFVRLTTDDPDVPTFQIPIYAIGRPAQPPVPTSVPAGKPAMKPVPVGPTNQAPGATGAGVQ